MTADLSLLNLILILFVGTIAGFINAMAGRGSILTLPLLIFIGLPAGVANGSNRIAIMVGCFSSQVGFYKNGVRDTYPLKWLLVPTFLGALIGTNLAIQVDDQLLSKVIGILMIFVALGIAFLPAKEIASKDIFWQLPGWKKWLCVVGFFFMGIYGGFIQAGVGVLMLLTLSTLGGMNLLQSNMIKNLIVLIYTVFVLGYFAMNGKVDWLAGSLLAVGMALGGWLGVHFAVKRGQRFIKIVVLISVAALSAKLLLQ